MAHRINRGTTKQLVKTNRRADELNEKITTKILLPLHEDSRRTTQSGRLGRLPHIHR